MAAAFAAMAGVVNYVDSLSRAFDKANEKAAESVSAYNEARDAVKSIKEQLRDIEDKISEINSKEKLNITDQEDIKNLEYEKQILERQLEIEQEREELARHQSVRDAVGALFTENVHIGMTTNATGTSVFGNIGGFTYTYKTVLDELADKRANLITLQEEYNSLLIDEKGNLIPVSNLTQAQRQQYDALGNAIDVLRGEILDYEDDLLTLYTVLNQNKDLLPEFGLDQSFLDSLGELLGITPEVDAVTGAAASLDEGINAVDESTEEVVTTISEALECFDEFTDGIDELNSALEHLDEGTLEIEDVVKLIEKFPELAKYVDFAADNFGDLREGIAKVKANTLEKAVDELMRFADTLDPMDASRTAIISLCEQMQNMESSDATDWVETLSQEFISLTDEINGSKQAIDDLTDAMNQNPNEGFETRTKAYETIAKAFEEGTVGTMSNVWEIARELGAALEVIEDKDPEKLFAWLNNTGAFFQEGTKGIHSFLDAIKGNGDALALFNEFSWEDGVLSFDIDNSRLEELGRIFQMDAESVYDLIVQLGQYYNIQGQTASDLITYMGEVASSAESTTDKLSALRIAAEQGLKQLGLSDEDIDIALETGSIENGTEEINAFLEAYIAAREEAGKPIEVSVTTTGTSGNLLGGKSESGGMAPTAKDIIDQDAIRQEIQEALSGGEEGWKIVVSGDLTTLLTQLADAMTAGENGEAYEALVDGNCDQLLADILSSMTNGDSDYEAVIAGDVETLRTNIKAAMTSGDDSYRAIVAGNVIQLIKDINSHMSVGNNGTYDANIGGNTTQMESDIAAGMTGTGDGYQADVGLNETKLNTDLISFLTNGGAGYSMDVSVKYNHNPDDPEYDGHREAKLNALGTGYAESEVTVYADVYANTDDANAALKTVQDNQEEINNTDSTAHVKDGTLPAKTGLTYVGALLPTINKYNASATVKDDTFEARNGLAVVWDYLDKISRNRTQTITLTYQTKREAMATGTKHAKGGMALLGDEYSASGTPKPELVVTKGSAYLAGVNGPVMAPLSPGDVVYTASETRRILSRSGLSGSIPAFAAGLPSSIWNGGTPSWYNGSSNTGNKSNTGSTTGSRTGSSNNSAETEYEKIDWIEVAIKRLEEAIANLNETASSTFLDLGKRIDATAREIGFVTNEIATQQAAYARYIQEANSVIISSNKNTDSAIKQKVREGTIDITEYSKETAELISEYQDWYDKAVACAYAVDTLHLNLAELYSSAFTAMQTDYTNQIEQMNHAIEMLNVNLDEYHDSSEKHIRQYTSQIKDLYQEKLPMLREELAVLWKKANEALLSGEIEKGSEAWYEMVSAINDVESEIQETQTSLTELYQTQFDSISKNYEHQVSLLEELTNRYNHYIDVLKEKGYWGS